MNHLAAWRIVRSEILKRLESEIAAGLEPSIWYADSMGSGDVSEFGAMMSNAEFLLGVPEDECLDWSAEIQAMEKAASK